MESFLFSSVIRLWSIWLLGWLLRCALLGSSLSLPSASCSSCTLGFPNSMSRSSLLSFPALLGWILYEFCFALFRSLWTYFSSCFSLSLSSFFNFCRSFSSLTSFSFSNFSSAETMCSLCLTTIFFRSASSMTRIASTRTCSISKMKTLSRIASLRSVSSRLKRSSEGSFFSSC